MRPFIALLCASFLLSSCSSNDKKKVRRGVQDETKRTTKSAEADKKAEVSPEELKAAQVALENIQAPSEMRTTCENAYAGVVDTISMLTAQLGDKAKLNTPKEEFFLKKCQSLPAYAQRCLEMSYVIKHQKECQSVEGKLDDRERATLKELAKAMRGE